MASDVLTYRNNVDVDRLGNLVQSIRQDPRSAHTTWHASVQWQGGFRSTARVRGFEDLRSDEPKLLGGDDSAANPVEQLLAALGNCLAVGYAANASVAGITIDALRIDVDGELDLHAFLGLSDGNPGFDTIRATVHLESQAPRDLVEELHCSVTRTSPVGNTLRRPIPVDIRLA